MPLNLSTEYLGLTLRNPMVVGASPFCDDVHLALQLQDAGAAALVMRSLFEEQIAPPPPVLHRPGRPQADFPEFAEYQFAPDQYLRQISHLKRTLTIPVIASLNGHRPGQWTNYAREIESAGADALELNFYQVITDANVAADQVETEILEVVGTLASALKIPIAVKLSPFHASIAQLAVALELAGAAGVVIFNRFYQPDINAEDLEVHAQLRLSEPGELLLRLRWLAILSPQLRGTLVATGGIHTSAGVVKSILAGAHAVQIVSLLLRHGPHFLAVLVRDLQLWMNQHGYDSIEKFRGLLNLNRCPDAAAFERANYIRTLQSWHV